MNGYARALAPLLLVFSLALTLGFSSAQEQSPPVISTDALIEAARAALDAGEPDDAAFLLEGVKPGEGDTDDLDFLHGSITLQRGDWQAAIARCHPPFARSGPCLRGRPASCLASRMEGRQCVDCWQS